MHYDVTVIGAGPAGCMAARVLSGYGFKVLLLEREVLPRDKPCGGFISPEAVELITGEFGPIPDGCLTEQERILGARLICEGGGDYEFPFSAAGLGVSRSRLDSWLASMSGAEVRDGCEVEEIEVSRFHVRTRYRTAGSREAVESTYLVGADGADSLVLRQLRPEFHRLYVSPRLERVMLVLSEGEMDWDPAWAGLVLTTRGKGMGHLFVRDGLIGMAVNFDSGRGWRDELDTMAAFLRDRIGLRLRGEPMRAMASSNRMATGGRYSLGAGCVFLAGEASGLLDPWGYGIRLALESGRMAADSLFESAGENITPHLRYRYRMQEVLEREKAQRRGLSGRVGDLEVASLAGDKSRAARRDLRALRRRLSK